jgi:hypothetical protein
MQKHSWMIPEQITTAVMSQCGASELNILTVLCGVLGRTGRSGHGLFERVLWHLLDSKTSTNLRISDVPTGIRTENLSSASALK